MKSAKMALAMLFACVPAFAGDGLVHKKAAPIRNQYIVVLNPGADDPGATGGAFARQHGGQVAASWNDLIRGFVISNVPETAAEAIARDPRVAVVEEDELASIEYCPDTRGRCADGSVPWQLDRIDQWKLPLNGKYYRPMARNEGFGTTIFVVDSGIRRTHTDFYSPDGTVNRVADGISFVNDGRGTDDCFNHGTTVSSAAAGRFSGAGKEATIVPVRVLDCNGDGSESQTISGLNWIAAHHGSRSIVNMSLAFSRSTALNSAVTNLFVNSGVVTIAAAGNNAYDACGYSPCSADQVICVGASTKSDGIASYSNMGRCVTMFAPGDKIGVGYFANDSAFDCNPGFSGTSMASPVVAGIAAQLWSINLTLTQYDVRQQLISNTIKNVLAIDTSSYLGQGTMNRLAASFSDGSSCDIYVVPPVQ